MTIKFCKIRTKFNWCLKKIIVLIIIIVVIFAAIIMSFKYDYKINGNYLTILSAMWSAAATALLGGIAYWQNKRYKELSDSYNKRIDNLMLTPECHLIDILSQKKDNITCMVAYTGKYCVSAYLEFCSLNLPMINTTVKEIELYDIKNKEHSRKVFSNSEISFTIEKFPMLTSCTSFLINITIPEEYSNLKTCCKLKLTYSNIYSAQIEKTIWLLKEQNGELTKYKTEPAMIIGEGTNGTPEV